jgi:hypothetical protein
MESDLIGIWNATMKVKSEKKRRSRPRCSLTGSVLESEIEHASDLLQVSCNWAFSLSEGVQNFETTFSDALRSLEKLRARTRKRKLRKIERQKIQGALWKLRKYSRQMASDEEPLTIIGIVEDVQIMDELSDMLKKVLADTKKL